MSPRILLLALIILLCGCTSTPSAPAEERTGGDWRSLHVVNHGLHAGLVLSRSDLLDELPALAEAFADGDFIELGWGDEAFYRAPQAGLGLALRALLWPSASVLHLVKVDGAPGRRFAASAVVEVRLQEAGYRQLLGFVATSFSRSGRGAPLELGPGLYGESRFYRAEGRYSLARTCNTWLAEALAAAGCPLRPARLVTSGQLMTGLRRIPTGGGACQAVR